MGNEEPEFITVASIATRLGVSKMTVYRLINNGELAAIKIGRTYRVPTKAFEQFLEDSKT